jgi:hypothetical protein
MLIQYGYDKKIWTDLIRKAFPHKRALD